MTYGVTSAGFVIKPLSVIKSEIEVQQRADIHPALNQTATSVLGQLNGIFSAKIREIWELNESVYNAFNPDSAEDAALDNDVALCPGIIRLAATKSTVTCTCNLDDGTYNAGTLIANVQDNPDARFVSTETIIAAGGPQDYPVEFEAEETGVVVALATTLNEIAEPVTGWNSVTNAADAELGTPIETNTALRLRRETNLRLGGSAHVDAIRADIAQVENVISASVLENPEDVIVSGMVPHSVRAIVWDGIGAHTADEDEIATAIFLSKSAGIDTNGAITKTVTDTQEFDHEINFDWATQVDIKVQLEVNVTTDAPNNWQDILKLYLTTYVQTTLGMGDDVVVSKISGIAAVFEFVEDVIDTQIAKVAEGFGIVNIVIADDEKAWLDSTDITFV